MTNKSGSIGTRTLPLTVSEAAFQSAVMDLAMLTGWRICHVRTVAVRHGVRIVHQTPYEGHAGLPDLILARNGVVLLVELKSQQGRATPEQRMWLAAADDLFNQNGYDAFAINYDLLTTSGVTFYTQRYQVRTAIAWVRSHASTFGIDAARGALYGYSAGGHLALIAGLTDPSIQAILTTSAISQPKRVADDAQGARPDTEPPNGAIGDADTPGLYANEQLALAGCPWYSSSPPSDLCTARWKDFSPQDQVQTTSAPVLAIDGTTDDFYTMQQDDAFCYWMRYGAVPRPCTAVHKTGYGHTQSTFLDDPTQGLAFLAANV